MLQEIPPFLLRGVSIVAVPANRPFQSGSHGRCLIAKLSLSLSGTGVHMVTSHAHAFERDKWRRHTACSPAQELTAQFVSPAESKCHRVRDAHGRGRAATDVR